MTFKETLERAATLAEEGFPVTERTARDIQNSADDMDEDLAEVWLVDGQGPLMYSILRVPDYAYAYRVLQTWGRDAFYEGEIAEAIVNKVQSVGGVMTLEDLAEFESEWVDPVSTNYHGYDIHQLPPNNQGFAALEMLNILEVCVPQLGFDLAELGPRDPQYWHLLVEAKKLAYSDLHRYNADPRFDPPPLETLLDKDYAASLCDRIDPNQARPADVRGNVEGGHGLLRHRGSLGQHGVVRFQHLLRFWRQGRSPGLRLPAPKSWSGFCARGGSPERGRTAQAALPHHHDRLHHAGR
jgi:gamma-glutamyltranspeptidase / glutathione hydrolase